MSLLRSPDNIIMPCSVNTYGKYLTPPCDVSFAILEITNYDVKFFISSAVN